MGARQSKEEKKAAKLLKERNEAIQRQRFYELFEMRQDWRFVFGDDDPNQHKEIYVIKDVTPRDVWMEDLYLFKKIQALRPDDLFHESSEYALKWVPPGSYLKIMIPFDDPIIQVASIKKVARLNPKDRLTLLFHFAPKDANQTMFREKVHPASLVSYHHRPEVLQKLCAQFLEDRMDIEEFKQTIGSHYDVWKRAMFNMLPEDEQPFHTYLTEKPEDERLQEEQKQLKKRIADDYLNGNITLQEYHDLKYPERKKKKDAESLKYPLPYEEGLCIICNNPHTGIIKCNICDNHVCVNCLIEKFHNEDTKEGSYLLIHRRFCLKLAPLKQIHLIIKPTPTYLRELRMTGQATALSVLDEEMKSRQEKEEEELEAGDSEDEEERAFNEEMRLLKEKKAYEAMMKENPPDLQHWIKAYDHKINKKWTHRRKDIMEFQEKIDEPGHSDMYVERLVRLRDEKKSELDHNVVKPLEFLLDKVKAMELEESETSKNFIEKSELILRECAAMMEMDSYQHFEDMLNGVTVEERAAIVAKEKEARRQAREAQEAREAAEAKAKEGTEAVGGEEGDNEEEKEEKDEKGETKDEKGETKDEKGETKDEKGETKDDEKRGDSKSEAMDSAGEEEGKAGDVVGRKE